MRRKQELFYRHTGIRRKNQLTQPRLIPTSQLELPWETIYHFQADDGAVTGPTPQEAVLRDLNARIFIEHVTELTQREGNPRRTATNPNTLKNEFRRKTRTLKPLRKDEALTINGRNVLVVNYAMLRFLQRYIASYKAGYFRWSNMAATRWAKVQELHERFGWNQYLELRLPETLPSYEAFLRMENGVTQNNLKTFDTDAKFDLFDLWLWLSEKRERSHLAQLSDEALERVNFIVRLPGYFFIINLGLLDQWRKDPEDEQDEGWEANIIQRRFLRLLQGVQDYLQGVTSTVVEGEIESPTPDSPTGSDTSSDNTPPPAAATTVDGSDDGLAPLDLDLDDEATLPARPASPRTREVTTPASDDDQTTTTVTLPQIEDETPTPQSAPTDDRPEAAVASRAAELRDEGLISLAAENRAIKDAQSYQQLTDPFGSGRSLSEMMTTDPKEFALPETDNYPDRDTVVDKSMLQSSVSAFHQHYLNNLYHKDIVQSVMAIQQQGVAVKDYQVETVQDAMNHYQIHTVKVKPVRGRQTTLRFRLPVVDEQGRFLSNGVTNRMRLQRVDQPIRKVNPAKVALTSYYNKTFVTRSARKAHDIDGWIHRQLTQRGVDETDNRVTGLRLGDVHDSTQTLPRMYSLLAKKFTAFQLNGMHCFFDASQRQTHFQDHYQLDASNLESDNTILVGAEKISGGWRAVTMDINGVLYRQQSDDWEVMGDFLDVAELDRRQAPLAIAEVTVSGKHIPLGFVLAYHLGLSTLLSQLNCEVSRFRRGERFERQADHYTLVFEDEVLVLSRLDERSSLILAGLNRYHQTLKRFSVWDFDRRDVYFQLLDDAGMTVRFLREIDTLFQAWVDPITKGLLEDMKEPTTFLGLLYRSAELLLNDFSLAEVDGAAMRYRGYERMAGMVYNELSRAAKTFNARASVGEAGLEMNPYTVWQNIVQDPTVSIVEEVNPIQTLREQEVFTYRGSGGRGSQSMVDRTRIFHDSDIGVVSESTVDSGEVGTIAYLSPNANLTDVRGRSRPYDSETDGPASVLSSSALNAPCVEHDDGKRINFVPIQQHQGISATGYQPTPLRTGYEQVIAHRASDMFATTATQAGKVTDKTRHSLTVTYQDGTVRKIQLGQRYGRAQDAIYPQTLTTELDVGDNVKSGDILTYNSKYFTPDRFNPGMVVWKAGVMATTAIVDPIQSLEDGSAISQALAEKLTTQLTEVRTIQLRFDQHIRDLVSVGDHVDRETILCTIEDPETADNPLFDEAAMDTLRQLSAMTPRAKLTGTVSKIECYYHGDFEDLSDNLQELVKRTDRERKREARANGEKGFSGQVDTGFRVNGNALDPDTLAIQVYIDHDVIAGTGDKGVFGNQMKTVFSKVMQGENTTQDGTPLDAIFGNTSIEERKVHSVKMMGTTNTLLRVLSKHVAAVYRGQRNG